MESGNRPQNSVRDEQHFDSNLHHSAHSTHGHDHSHDGQNGGRKSVFGAIRPVDHLVLELLRREEGLTVTDLVERLEVTQTAVRARLDRLEEMELVERRKLLAGRGRPVFQYFLSSSGWRQVGVTYADLATAVWTEINELKDDQQRTQIMDGVSRRMGQAYARLLPEGSLSERLTAMAQVLTDRKIPTRIDDSTTLPVLTVQACPFPDLALVNQRSACELEQKMLSEAIGEEMELSCCRLDGHSSCQFRPVDKEASASES